MRKSITKINAPLEIFLNRYGSCLDWRKTLCTSFKIENELLKGYLLHTFFAKSNWILKKIFSWRIFFFS